MVVGKKDRTDDLLAAFEKWRQEAKMYAELSKVSKEYSSKISKMNADLHKELQKIADRGEKITYEAKKSLWKELGHDKQLKKLEKEANDAMKAIKKKYASAP